MAGVVLDEDGDRERSGAALFGPFGGVILPCAAGTGAGRGGVDEAAAGPLRGLADDADIGGCAYPCKCEAACG